MEVVQCLLVFMIEGDDVGLDGGLEVEADEVGTVRESVRIGDAMQMERRPALMGAQMSRDHPATRAAGAAGAAAAAPEVTPEHLINCSGVLLL
jgi:hypothetical protein